ncbi:ATP-binding cassette domain-containing protein [Nocardia exalbida]|uniref:ATP-binding cassette domain-containing protein n=1 Tax=Nocardia exalbida TaxID=290231 RepID=UPI0002FAE5B5|nr:ABC transporter ATP-binding protein [Nocardia exalbida]
MTLTAAAVPSADTVTDTVLSVRNLRVGFPGNAGDVVEGVGFDLWRGEILAIVGESGSGKSVTTRSLVGLAGAGARVRADRFELFGTPALGLSERQWRGIRGARIGLVFQDALVALDPLRTIADEMAEALRATPRSGRAARIDELLISVGIADPEVRKRQRPFQLSGGQRQRALIASALAGDPDILIADEPTTALDVTVQAQVLDLLVRQVAGGRSMILVSHDLAVVASVADRILVMKAGRVVEQGPAEQVIGDPRHAYTRALIAAVPRGRAGAPPSRSGAPIFTASALTKAYRVRGRAVPAVADIGFEVRAGEVLGVVGESGSGKSTVAKMITGLIEPDGGEMRFAGAPLTPRTRRPGRIGLVAQDSTGSFDPRYRVGEIIGESVALRVGRRERRAEVMGLLDAVRLPADSIDRHPRELSGGQRQRVNIARALGSRPELVVCDEPVSALDISVQAQILELIAELARERGVGVIFISHDLAVVRQICHRLLVLHGGVIVETGSSDDVFTAPTSPYTRSLLDSVPRLAVPDPTERPSRA